MTYFVLLVLYRCFVKVVETWGVESFIQGNLDIYLLTTFWLIDWDKNWDNFDLMRWSCCEVYRALVLRKVTDISICCRLTKKGMESNEVEWRNWKKMYSDFYFYRYTFNVLGPSNSGSLQVFFCMAKDWAIFLTDLLFGTLIAENLRYLSSE